MSGGAQAGAAACRCVVGERLGRGRVNTPSLLALCEGSGCPLLWQHQRNLYRNGAGVSSGPGLRGCFGGLTIMGVLAPDIHVGRYLTAVLVQWLLLRKCDTQSVQPCTRDATANSPSRDMAQLRSRHPRAGGRQVATGVCHVLQALGPGVPWGLHLDFSGPCSSQCWTGIPRPCCVRLLPAPGLGMAPSRPFLQTSAQQLCSLCACSAHCLSAAAGFLTVLVSAAPRLSHPVP